MADQLNNDDTLASPTNGATPRASVDQSDTGATGAQPPVAPKSMPDPSQMSASDVLKAVPAQSDKFFDPMRDPEFLRQAAMNAFQNGSLKGGFEWLAHVHNAYNENGIDAARALLRDDPDTAITRFNSSGRFTDVTGATKNKDGTWTITREGGQTGTIDPKSWLMSMQSPDAYAHFQQQAPLIEAEAYRAREQGLYYGQVKGESAERVAEINRQRGVESAAIRATPQMLAQERQKGQQEMQDKYGARASFDKSLDNYQKALVNGGILPNGADGKPLTPHEAALRDTLGHPDLAGFLQNPNDPNEIIVVDGRGNRFATIGSPTDFQRITGRPFVPARQPAPPGAPPGPKPSTVPYAGPPGRQPTAQGPAGAGIGGVDPMIENLQRLDDGQLQNIVNDPDPRHGTPAARAAAKSILAGRAKDRAQHMNTPPPPTLY